MTKLKLLFLTLLSVLSFNLFSQTQVYTSPTSGPNICDGTAVLDTTNLTMTSIVWQGMGMIINQGSYMVTNLCPGTYSVTFNSNGTAVTLTFTITAGSFNPCLNFGGFTTPTNSVDSVTCDGIVTASIINGTGPYTYQWSNGSTTPTINNLCPGQYCCYVADANGCTATLCDTVGIQSTNTVDTLYLTSAGNCNNPIDTLYSMVEDCNLNFNLVDTVYVTFNIPQNPLDSVFVTWTLVDTNGVNITSYQTNYIMSSVGCYNFLFIIYCFQKSMDYKIIVINHTEYLDLSGINELFGNSKQLISVTDLLGRDTKIQTNKMLIYTYSDGSREIKYINE
jgi:hypothetical protein